MKYNYEEQEELEVEEKEENIKFSECVIRETTPKFLGDWKYVIKNLLKGGRCTMDIYRDDKMCKEHWHTHMRYIPYDLTNMDKTKEKLTLFVRAHEYGKVYLITNYKSIGLLVCENAKHCCVYFRNYDAKAILNLGVYWNTFDGLLKANIIEPYGDIDKAKYNDEQAYNIAKYNLLGYQLQDKINLETYFNLKNGQLPDEMYYKSHMQLDDLPQSNESDIF